MKKGLGFVSLAVLFLAVSMGVSLAAEKVVLKLGLVDPQTINYYDGALAIAKEVREATNGVVEIEVYAGGVLGGERDMYEGAQMGTIDIATAANAVMASFIPEMAVLDQPFLFADADEAHRVIDGKLGELIAAKALQNGIHIVGYMESGFRNVFSTRPVKGLDDFKGLKIRTMENDIHMAIFNQLGGIATPMASNEQYSALQQHTIDAGEAAISSIFANRFFEVAKNVSYTRHLFVYIGICVSDRAWNRIPAEYRDAFAAAAKRGANAQRQYLVDANEKAEGQLRAAGVTFHDIDTEPLRKAALPAIDKFKNRMPQEWLDAIAADKKAK
jgi:tripartite ATP-independent transporter DctP family solute receptor